MATRKPSAPVAPPPAAPDEELVAPEDSLSGLLAEIGGGEDASITVYRCGPNQQQTYVFKTTPAAFSLDDLRDKYNGGQFRLYIARNGQLWKNRVVSVEPKQVTGASEPAPSAVSELAAVMREGFMAQANAMRELAQRQAAAPPPPFAGMDLPAIITAISGAVVALKPPAPPPVQGESASRAIEMFMKGIDMARELRGDGGGGEGGLMGLVQTAMKSPILAAAVQGALQQQQQPPQRQALPPPPQPQPPAAQPPQQPTAQSFASETSTQPTQEQSMIGFYLNLLCKKAADGSDPVLYAEMVLDNLNDDQLTALLDMKPTPVDALSQIVPEVAQHRAWFDQLLNAVRDALASADPDGGQSGQVNGAANAPSSAAPDVLGGTSQG